MIPENIHSRELSDAKEALYYYLRKIAGVNYECLPDIESIVDNIAKGAILAARAEYLPLKSELNELHNKVNVLLMVIKDLNNKG